MTSFRNKAPKITWGASFANTLNIGYPLDNVRSGDEPRAGSSTDETPSGVRDAWNTGTDYLLFADIRWIPQVTTAAPVATGWDTASTGFRLFLQWAREQNAFRFFPDAASGSYITCYLVEPLKGVPDAEPDGQRRLSLVLQGDAAFDGY